MTTPRAYGSSKTLAGSNRSPRGVRRPFDPIAVDLSRRDPRHEHVPVVVGPVRRRIDPDDAGRGSVVPIKEQELDARGCPREQAEVDATVNDRSGQGRASADALGGGTRRGTSPGLLDDGHDDLALSCCPSRGPRQTGHGRLNSLPRFGDVVPVSKWTCVIPGGRASVRAERECRLGRSLALPRAPSPILWITQGRLDVVPFGGGARLGPPPLSAPTSSR